MSNKNYLNSKEHRDWSKAIRARDGECVICGSKKNLNAHHLIPKEVKRFRSQMRNGITLCARHHTKYGNIISPHSDASILFYFWMQLNRPKQLCWVKEMYEEMENGI